MYFLTKLHKNPPGIRPIVSGCSGPTENISSFLDYVIKPLVPRIRVPGTPPTLKILLT